MEVPKWRHALINIAHPLLKQGLVILDTPGLNAIGAEPELTVNLIPQAHAVVFILAADTGVTKSDLSIWREHLITESAQHRFAPGRPEQDRHPVGLAEHPHCRCRRRSSGNAPPRPKSWACPRSRSFRFRRRKAWSPRSTNDAKLLQASQLPVLERALSLGVMGQRQKILRSAVAAGIGELRVEAGRAITIRRRDLAEQMLELKGLRGKNIAVIKHMRSRIEQEQVDFDVSGARIHAVRSVHLKLLREVFTLLGTRTLKTEMAELTATLRQPGIKLGVRKAYAATFDRLRLGLRTAQAKSADIQSMLTGTFRQLNLRTEGSMNLPSSYEVAALHPLRASGSKSSSLTSEPRCDRTIYWVRFWEEILAVIARHVTLDPEKVQVKLDRGGNVSTLEVDIEILERRQCSWRGGSLERQSKLETIQRRLAEERQKHRPRHRLPPGAGSWGGRGCRHAQSRSHSPRKRRKVQVSHSLVCP